MTTSQSTRERDPEEEEWSGYTQDAEVLRQCRLVLRQDSSRDWSIGALAQRLHIAPGRIGQILTAAGFDLPAEG